MLSEGLMMIRNGGLNMGKNIISPQRLINVTVNEGCIEAVAVRGPFYVTTCGPGGPVMNEFVSPEYDSFTLLGEDYYVDVLHNLLTDRITMSVEKWNGTKWMGITPGGWETIDNFSRRLFFYPEPLKIRCYFIGSKS